MEDGVEECGEEEEDEKEEGVGEEEEKGWIGRKRTERGGKSRGIEKEMEE